MKTQNKDNTGSSDWEKILNDQDFYELMQSYRHAPLIDQEKTTESFEAVKDFIRNLLSIQAKRHKYEYKRFQEIAFDSVKEIKQQHREEMVRAKKEGYIKGSNNTHNALKQQHRAEIEEKKKSLKNERDTIGGTLGNQIDILKQQHKAQLLNQKINLTSLFHGVLKELYGKELADSIMSQVNKVYAELQKTRPDVTR